MHSKTTKLQSALITISLFVFFNLNSFAQTDFRPGYYITWEKDTVYGLIDLRGEIRNSKFCSFKKNEKEEEVRFYPFEIKSYRFIDSKYYISKEIVTKDGSRQVFLELLLSGITNLYFFNGNEYYSYYLEDREGNLLELKKELKIFELEGRGTVTRQDYRYIGLLKATFADCMEIQSDMDNIDLTHKSLINLSKKYHDYVCDDEICIIYEKKLPVIKVQFAPFLGLGISTFYTDKNFQPNFNFDPDYYMSVGFLSNIILPRFSKNLSIQIEAQTFKNDFHLSQEIDRGYFINVNDIHINTISLQSSVAIKYTYPKRKIRPSIAFGILFNYFVKYDTKFIQTREYSSDSFTSDLSDFPIGTKKWGGVIQLGCNYRIFKNRELFTHLKFFKSTGIEPFISAKPTFNTPTFNLGDSYVRKYLTQVNFSIGVYLNKM